MLDWSKDLLWNVLSLHLDINAFISIEHVSDRLNMNICYWLRIHFSDENKFILRHSEARLRVWRFHGTAYDTRILFEQLHSAEGLDCHLAMLVLGGTSTSLKSRDNVPRNYVYLISIVATLLVVQYSRMISLEPSVFESCRNFCSMRRLPFFPGLRSRRI